MIETKFVITKQVMLTCPDVRFHVRFKRIVIIIKLKYQTVSNLNFSCCPGPVSYSSCVCPSLCQGPAHKSTQRVWLDMTAPIKYCWWEEWGPGLAAASANIVRRIDVSDTFALLFRCRVHPDLLCLSVRLLPLSVCPLCGVTQLFRCFFSYFISLHLSCYFSPHTLSIFWQFL